MSINSQSNPQNGLAGSSLQTRTPNAVSMEGRACESGANPSRRDFFSSVSGGIMGGALLSLLEGEAEAAAQQTHFAPTAKSVIHLFMNGGPSQMDLFDPKPELDRLHGQSYFNKIAGEVENPQDAGSMMRCPYTFAQYGQCGMPVSEVMPHLATCVDDIAFIRSMHTTNLTHEPALFIAHSGRMQPGLPTLGAWVSYGLGSENQNLPAYVVLEDPGKLPVNGTQNWQAGFLPPQHQGTRFRATGAPVLNLKPAFNQPEAVQTLERDLIAKLNARHQQRRPWQPRLGARMASYELAARMQLEASDALDLSRETDATKQLYGLDSKATDSYGRRCLIARRLVERGVRFVQLFIDFQIWDNHTNLRDGLRGCCDKTDQPVAALLKDLKQRGLLDQTLVVWGGEFGRLPIAQLPGDKNAAKAGRDHNKNAMITWMAGGGTKGGVIHGATDDLGLAAVQDRVSIPDWHATILHTLGLDHHQLVYPRNGLEERLTHVAEARIVKEILK